MRGSETNRRPPPWIGDGPCGRGTTPVHHRLATAALRLDVAQRNASGRDVALCNGGQSGDAYCAVSDWDARKTPRWDAEPPAHAGAVGIAARRSFSNGLPAPPSHQSRLAEPAETVYSSSSSPWVPAPERRNTKPPQKSGGGVHIAHLAGQSPAGIGTWRKALVAGLQRADSLHHSG